MGNIEFVFCNNIYILRTINEYIKLIDKRTGIQIEITEDQLEFSDEPLLQLANLIYGLIR